MKISSKNFKLCLNPHKAFRVKAFGAASFLMSFSSERIYSADASSYMNKLYTTNIFLNQSHMAKINKLSIKHVYPFQVMK